MASYVYAPHGVSLGAHDPSPSGEPAADEAVWVRPSGGTWSQAEAARCGFFPFTPSARPADTETTVYEDVYTLVDGTWVQSWEPRPASDRESRQFRLEQAIATLRAWADDAEGTIVTTQNAVTVLQVTVDRLGTFFDRFADLLENVTA